MTSARRGTRGFVGAAVGAGASPARNATRAPSSGFSFAGRSTNSTRISTVAFWRSAVGQTWRTLPAYAFEGSESRVMRAASPSLMRPTRCSESSTCTSSVSGSMIVATEPRELPPAPVAATTSPTSASLWTTIPAHGARTYVFSSRITAECSASLARAISASAVLIIESRRAISPSHARSAECPARTFDFAAARAAAAAAACDLRVS